MNTAEYSCPSIPNLTGAVRNEEHLPKPSIPEASSKISRKNTEDIKQITRKRKVELLNQPPHLPDRGAAANLTNEPLKSVEFDTTAKKQLTRLDRLGFREDFDALVSRIENNERSDNVHFDSSVNSEVRDAPFLTIGASKYRGKWRLAYEVKNDKIKIQGIYNTHVRPIEEW